jgi:AcrR family transcriptional regulator
MTAAVMPARDGRAAAGGSGPGVRAVAAGSRRREGTRPGRPGAEVAAPSRVSDIQRQRILAGMIDVAAERGVASVTVAHIVARSGVSRRTFYELFSDREACLLAALDQAIAHATAAVLPAYTLAAGARTGARARGGSLPSAREGKGRAGWQERIRGALTAVLQFLDEEPGMARLCVVESLGAGPQALQRRTRIVHALIAAVDEGRGEAKPGKEPPLLAGEAVVGAVLAVIHARLVEAGSEPLSNLLPALMATIVLPYLGQPAAEKELHRPAPQLKTTTRARKDPLDGLDMRLTYRTVRVLIAIAGHPHASNREVATAAGIADQGQISKLLTRLQSLGLIRNDGHGPLKGAPNAWTLTTKGIEVEHSLRMDADSHQSSS